MTENEQPRTKCDPSISTSTFSERRSRKDEPLEDLESEITETWQKLHGYTIIAGERLQEKINESVTCLCCQGNVELVENLRTWFHLDVPVKAVRRTKLVLHFRWLKKSRAFAMNCASVLGFLAIGGSHVTASKVFSFLGLYMWSENFELTNL